MTWQEFHQKEYGVLDGSALSHDQEISLQLDVENSKEMKSDEQKQQNKIFIEVLHSFPEKAMNALVYKRQRLADWLCSRVRNVDTSTCVGPMQFVGRRIHGV